jgi:hypothetical protein
MVLMVALLPFAAFGKAPDKGGGAFLKSLLVPGWGQYTLGQKNAALAFFGTDMLLIGGMLSLNSYGHSTRIDYKAMAAAYAGVVGNHNHDFYVDVGNWMTTREFNERRLQGREFDALYTARDDQWSWTSDERRAEMEKTRIKSDRAFNSVLYLVGGMVMNHVISAVHAGRTAAVHREHADRSPDWNLYLQPDPASRGAAVQLSVNF